jgi:hypothetical protein
MLMNPITSSDCGQVKVRSSMPSVLSGFSQQQQQQQQISRKQQQQHPVSPLTAAATASV